MTADDVCYEWRHPRPPRDPRLICLAIGLSFVAFAQTFFTAPPTSVAAQAYTTPAAITVAGLVVVSSVLLLSSAFCESQHASWGCEIGACIGYVGQSGIQFIALVTVNPQWWSSSTMDWTIFWGLGNLIRLVRLVRRVW